MPTDLIKQISQCLDVGWSARRWLFLCNLCRRQVSPLQCPKYTWLAVNHTLPRRTIQNVILAACKGSHEGSIRDLYYIIFYDMIFITCIWVSTRWQVGKILQKWKIKKLYVGRNNTQNNTKTQRTQNKKQNIQNKETNITWIINKHKTINYNMSKSKRRRK